MQCPIDGTTLMIADRNGVEIDWCPQCRGVWLDRGELDKIIAGSVAAQPTSMRSDSYVSHDHRSREQTSYKKKKGIGSFLEDIFDF